MLLLLGPHQFLLVAIFVESNLVSIRIDLEVKLEVAAIVGSRLRLKELLVITLCQKLFITRRR